MKVDERLAIFKVKESLIIHRDITSKLSDVLSLGSYERNLLVNTDSLYVTILLVSYNSIPFLILRVTYSYSSNLYIYKDRNLETQHYFLAPLGSCIDTEISRYIKPMKSVTQHIKGVNKLWLDIKNLIETMTEDQMNRDVVVKKESEDEYYVPDYLRYTNQSSCDVSDEDQPYLTISY